MWRNYHTDSVGGLFRTMFISCVHSVSVGAMAILNNEIHSAITATIGLKFCTRLEGDNMQNRVGANFEFPPLKNLAPFEFCICIAVSGTKNFKSALLEFPKLFQADIFGPTRPEVWKLSLRFSRVGKFFTSIYLHFCMFCAPFNISGTFEARALKFSHTIQR